MLFVFFFFFQAEDGIRDLTVTGVQTCALPIYMALEAIKPNRDDDRRSAEPQPAVTACPICGGGMEVVYARNNQNVSVCTDCHSGLTVPGSAWEIVRIKREAKWMPKP